MTAVDLIESIFSRAQGGMPGNQRRITADQLAYLRKLIDQDPEARSARCSAPGALTWTPAGFHQYILADDDHGRTLTRLSNIAWPGMLF
jgi:hypothetical protein